MPILFYLITGQIVSDSQYEDKSFIKVNNMDNIFIIYVLVFVRTLIKIILTFLVF